MKDKTKWETPFLFPHFLCFYFSSQELGVVSQRLKVPLSQKVLCCGRPSGNLKRAQRKGSSDQLIMLVSRLMFKRSQMGI